MEHKESLEDNDNLQTNIYFNENPIDRDDNNLADAEDNNVINNQLSHKTSLSRHMSKKESSSPLMQTDRILENSPD